MKSKNIYIIILICLTTLFFAQCNKVRKPCREKVNPDCYCIQIYDPVCGCNGKTYGNSCEAECSGITEYTSGECK